MTQRKLTGSGSDSRCVRARAEPPSPGAPGGARRRAAARSARCEAGGRRDQGGPGSQMGQAEDEREDRDEKVERCHPKHAERRSHSPAWPRDLQQAAAFHCRRIGSNAPSAGRGRSWMRKGCPTLPDSHQGEVLQIGPSTAPTATSTPAAWPSCRRRSLTWALQSEPADLCCRVVTAVDIQHARRLADVPAGSRAGPTRCGLPLRVGQGPAFASIVCRTAQRQIARLDLLSHG